MILDTNALSAIVGGNADAVKGFRLAAQVAIPVIVLGEYRFGIAQSRHRREYERWLAEMLEAARVLTVDEETAGWYAQLRLQLKQSGTPIPSNDIWIAALGCQHKLPIFSRDVHFDFVKGLRRLTW